MNLPTTPGQNASGKKGASVVSVPERMGTNTSPAAALAEFLISMSGFGKDPVRVFDDHNGIIHHNPQCKNKREHDQHVQGEIKYRA